MVRKAPSGSDPQLHHNDYKQFRTWVARYFSKNGSWSIEEKITWLEAKALQKKLNQRSTAGAYLRYDTNATKYRCLQTQKLYPLT